MLQPLAPALNLPQWLRQRARRWPDAVALVDGHGSGRYSHAALDHLVGRCAAGLAAQGFAPGDVLPMWAPNSPEWPIVALAAWVAGGAVWAVDPAGPGLDLALQQRRWRVRLAFTTPALLPRLRAGVAEAGPLRLIVPGEAAGTVSFTTLLACAEDEPRPLTGPQSLAWVGTHQARNGSALRRPGLARLSHGQLLAQIAAHERELPLRAGEVTLSLQSMSRASGLVQGTLAPLAQGAAVVTLASFDADSVARALLRHRVTRLLLPQP